MADSAPPAQLLDIRPQRRGREQGVRDRLVWKLEMALSRARPAARQTGGYRRCACGEVARPTALVLPGGLHTNELALHYLEFHRSEVPEAELEKLRAL